MTLSGLSPSAVQELAALTGIPVDDEAMAARIATGGGAAVAAVAAARAALYAAGVVDEALLGVEPSDHLALLESLAEPVAEGRTRSADAS